MKIDSVPKEWWKVKILPHEYEEIKKKGTQRNSNTEAKGWTSLTADVSDQWHILGYAGEYAVSLLLGTTINNQVTIAAKDLKKADLGSNIEVKTRRESDANRWDLAVNENQLSEDRIYVLCLGCLLPDWVVVVGWETGREIKSRGRLMKHGATGHGFYVFSHKKLKDVDLLLDLLRNSSQEKTQ